MRKILQVKNYLTLFFCKLSVVFCALSVLITTTTCNTSVSKTVYQNFRVNFVDDFDSSKVSLDFNILASNETIFNNILSSNARNNILSQTHKELNTNYKLSNLLYYSLRVNEERFNDYQKVKSITVILDIEGEISNIDNDEYCAMFVKFSEPIENAVLSGDYTYFENDFDYNIKNVNSSISNNKMILEIDNVESDGFIILLQKDSALFNYKIIIIIVGIVISVILLILLIWAIRGYVIERRRIKYNNNAKDIEKLTNEQKNKARQMNTVINKAVENKTPEENSKQIKNPKLPPKPALPKNNIKKNNGNN